jgi:hypothetical protein
MSKALFVLVIAGVLATVLFTQVVDMNTDEQSTAELQINDQVNHLRSQLKYMEVQISTINEQLDELNEQKTQVQEQRRLESAGPLEGP